MASSSLLPTFRWVLLGGIALLVIFQAVQVVREVKETVSRPNLRPVYTHHEQDLLQLSELNTLCLRQEDTIVSSRLLHSTLSRDAEMKDLLAEILRCPPVEVFLPTGIRSHGYCEDGMAYVQFLQTRAMPMWIYEKEFHIEGKTYSYHDLCPDTAIILMNHYWDGLDEKPNFPSSKKLVLMPNIEMYELKGSHYHRVDYVLAKTQEAYNRITQWYKNNTNPRKTQVFYTMHTSSDPTLLARTKAKHEPALFGVIEPNDWIDLKVFHANGRSPQKNTPRILDCWRDRPDFPVVHMYSSDGGSMETYKRHHVENETMLNVDFHHGEFVEPAKFGKLLAEASVILCPSIMEGFGHYINQARASGALVLTTDAPPMNELIDETSGVLISPVITRNTGDRVLMGPATEFDLEPSAICAAMDRVLAMSPSERASRAREGQRRYYNQLTFFKQAMDKFRLLVEKDLSTPK
ncbi:unnamed protein product [Aphanomyces euteiches]|nr:hypothetical protein Ae201684P_001475 [Aphanomyces euteiches]KAH9153623.1 hypothetical protein AeRB84_004161 [Aphanomyces euteiches]